jgi:tRNA threonylcarbamoyladenosine biosynthesis protein TsaB
MTLYINTISSEEIIIALYNNDKLLIEKRINAPRQQSEKLIPAIDKLLKSKKVKLIDLDKIKVENYGGSFTSLRIGVITANALAYALKIPVEANSKINKKNKKFGSHSIVEPVYDREPNIGISKKTLVH